MHDDRLPENVNVADATLFPRSLGNPPILTIIAMARRIAAICAAQVAPAHLARSRR
jgi:choline dehydrogenase-like flavoprotein